MSTVIRVSGLGKEYIIGGREKGNETFREMLTSSLLAPFRRLRKLKGEVAQEERFWALKDVSFEVQRGEVVGIIGRNGAGKSTLLKILSRITEPTEGEVEIRGRVASLLEVGTGFHPELTGRENIYLNGAILGMSRAEIARKFDEIVAFAEVEKFLDTPVKRYSSGMYVRLAFAVAAHLEPEILIVDEVLAVGDGAFQRKCMGKMEEVARQNRTVLFVSHNLDAIRQLCSQGLLLENGRIKSFGQITDVAESYLISIASQENTISSVIDLGCSNSDFDVLRIDVFDAKNQPKPIVYTWDEVIFRIHFYSIKSISRASVVFQIATLSGTILHLCSTSPDRNLMVDFKEGYNSVDLYFKRLWLSAGTYRIGAGLAISNIRWLSKKLDVGVLIIYPKDVYKAGMAPQSTRYLFPAEYDWFFQDKNAL